MIDAIAPERSTRGIHVYEQEWLWKARITAEWCMSQGWYLCVEKSQESKSFDRIGPFDTEQTAWLWYAESRASKDPAISSGFAPDNDFYEIVNQTCPYCKVPFSHPKCTSGHHEKARSAGLVRWCLLPV